MAEYLKHKYIRQARMLRLIKMIHRLRIRPHTKKEIQLMLDCSGRTANRYIDIIEDMGIPIEALPGSGSTVKYVIFGPCPFCG